MNFVWRDRRLQGGGQLFRRRVLWSGRHGARGGLAGDLHLLHPAVVRGLDAEWFREGSARELVRPPAEDLFR